jgi:DNA-binding PadR family transcriptional regulator
MDGLVTARLASSDRGPARKYYTITAEGKGDLDAAEAEWTRLSGAITHILETRTRSENE